VAEAARLFLNLFYLGVGHIYINKYISIIYYCVWGLLSIDKFVHSIGLNFSGFLVAPAES
jgi:hypothetical protein